jgi:hypothetical protein
MFDPFLLARCLSQALQACLVVAFCASWARRTGRTGVVDGIRWGVIASVPATIVASWLFGQTSYQARWEAGLATIALGLGTWFTLAVSKQDDASVSAERQTSVAVLCAVAALLVIVRQMMEIGVVLKAAIFDVRSIPAILTVVAGTGTGILASLAWMQLAQRLSTATLLKATRVFAVLFVAQVAFYAVHEGSEAGWLPWSEFLHTATEPYGPDSTFGTYATVLLLFVPLAVVGTIAVNEYIADPITRIVTYGSVVIAAIVLLLSVTGLPQVSSPETVANAATDFAVSHDPERLLGTPHILFSHTHRDADYGHLAVAALDTPNAAREVAQLKCSRVSFGLDRGVCVQARSGVKDAYDAVIFNNGLWPVHTVPLTGTVSRTRTSADGRYGAVTTFLTGQAHGYAAASFSTQTLMLDMRAGTSLGDLEQFVTIRDGKPFKSADFNFWGVTFVASDSNTFYATLRTGTSYYLVRGDVAKRTMTAIAENVECPSLSPDEKTIAFKRRVNPMPTAWRLFVLDLATMTDRPVAMVSTYVDDQVEWLDSKHILFALPHLGTSDVWVAPIDASGPSRLLIRDAESPIVVRQPANTRPVTTTH